MSHGILHRVNRSVPCFRQGDARHLAKPSKGSTRKLKPATGDIELEVERFGDLCKIAQWQWASARRPLHVSRYCAQNA